MLHKLRKLQKCLLERTHLKTPAKAYLLISLSVILISVSTTFFLLRDHQLFFLWREPILEYTLVSLAIAFGFTFVLELSLREQEKRKK